jgi:8-oxo-dGTP diphosphatase
MRLGRETLCYARRYTKPEGHVWFFAAHLAAGREVEIVFGDEGQGWSLMRPETFIAAPDAVPVLQRRLRDYLDR